MSDLRDSRAFLVALLATACLTVAADAVAGITIDTTRVVYPAAKREVTFNVRNTSQTPSLVQTWIDSGDANSRPGESKVPFVLTPPLFRLDPTKSQSVRMVYTQEPLPADRESLFWLNVLDVPPRAAANPDRPNQLEMAFKHRMKVFFRPQGLKGSAADAPTQLTWQLATKDGKLVGIQVKNPTPFHVSVIRVGATVDGKAIKFKAEMIGPFAESTYALEEPVSAPAAPAAVEYTFVNDYGGNVKATASASVP